jgi:hypothetical protein
MEELPMRYPEDALSAHRSRLEPPASSISDSLKLERHSRRMPHFCEYQTSLGQYQFLICPCSFHPPVGLYDLTQWRTWNANEDTFTNKNSCAPGLRTSNTHAGEASKRIIARSSNDTDCGIGVDLVRCLNLRSFLVRIVLRDADGIYPQIPKPYTSSDSQSIFESLWQVLRKRMP